MLLTETRAPQFLRIGCGNLSPMPGKKDRDALTRHHVQDQAVELTKLRLDLEKEITKELSTINIDW